MNPVELGIFSSRIEAACDEMGVVLRRAAFSPNIKERLDFSCAVFDAHGQLCAQAAHIPVHLGSMAYAMQGIVSRFEWRAGDMVIVNDPYLGGTHLPDVALIAPLLVDGELVGFVANRAHHADIGANAPGSMPLSRSLEEEGLIIAPVKLIEAGVMDEVLFDSFMARLHHGERAQGDFLAQISANRAGVVRLEQLIDEIGSAGFRAGLDKLNDYAERLAWSGLAGLPQGRYRFSDVMDGDGYVEDLTITCEIEVSESGIVVDFTGTAPQAAGNINCPISVAAAAVYYVFRCLMPSQTPGCAGAFRKITVQAPLGCLLNARYPAAVAAGNVETSTRVVDVVMGALAQAIPARIPAASHGSMNNIAMGARSGDKGWDYYETLGGGMGAGPTSPGLSAVQTHMTNTLNTPIEALEMNYPVRVRCYAVHRGSGGRGRQRGGDGLIREFEFLAPAQVTLLTERRRHAPWGLQGGGPGRCGRNTLNGRPLAGKTEIGVGPGDRVRLETPGGGGFGPA